MQNIENTTDLKQWILNNKISQEERIDFEGMIEAFSEYIVCTNPDYLYNKTYITSYISDFFECSAMLRNKYMIIEKNIIPMLQKEKIDMLNVIIRIDEIWNYFRGKCTMSNNIDINVAKNPNIKLELKYMGEEEYVIAKYIKRNNDFQESIEKCVKEFINRLGEFNK